MAYRYEAFNFGILSEIALPELLECEREPVVTIPLAGALDSVPEHDSLPEWCAVDGDYVHLGWQGVGTFRLGDGEILVIPDPIATPERIRLFLLGAVMGVFLHRRGLMTLHGSAVAMDKGAVAFIGPKWSGKSTTAAILVDRGHRLVTDDIVAIEMGSSEPAVCSGFPQIKLWPDSLAAIGQDSSEIPQLHPDFEKRDYRVDSMFADPSVSLNSIFLLEPADELAIERLEPAAALPELIRCWYCARFGYDALPALGISRIFRQSTELARTVPIHRLSVPRSLDSLAEVAEALENGI